MSTAEENPITTPTEEEEVEAKAAELFAEAASAREGSPGDGQDDAGAEAGAATEPNKDDEPGKDTTAGEGTAETAGQSGGGEGSAAAAAGSGEGDIWADVKPEAKAAYEAAIKEAREAEHRFKSREGREAALQRQIAELRRQGGQEEPERKPLKDLLTKETVDALGEDYPDLKPVLEALSAAVERIDGVEQQVGEAKSTAVAAATAPEEKALAQAVPNWADLAKDERFMSWVEDQPKQVRDTVDANWAAITNAAEAAKVFTSFAEHIAPPKQEEEPDSGAGSSKRDRQKSGARAATVTAPTAAAGDSADADVAFAQAAAKKDRERGLRT